MRKYLILCSVAALLALATAGQAQAWGAFHAGFTRVGYGGVEHYGRTAAVGPYGAYSGAHYGAAGYGGGYAVGGARYGTASGAYGGGYAAGGYHYSTSYGGGYAAGGYHYSPTYGGSAWNYSNGVYRVY